jgi:hypothetical protein
MRTKRRTIRELGVIGLVLALVLGIVVAAVQADGRRTVRPETNDGGAWLINTRAGVVGHVNRGAGEVTGVVRLAEPGHEIDTEQSGNTVLVSNESTDTISLIDPRSFQSIATVDAPDGVRMRADGDTAIVWTESPLRVWRIDRDLLSQIDSIDEATTLLEPGGDGLATVTRFGTIVAVATDLGTVHRAAPDDVEASTVDIGEVGRDVVGVTASGDTALLLMRAGTAFLLPDGSDQLTEAVSLGGVAALGQPSLPDEPILAVRDDGTILRIERDRNVPLAVSAGEIDGAAPLPPLFHRGCTFAVASRPPTLTRRCADEVETFPLDGTTGASLRLRLVNGWVWINDLTSGATWVLNADTPLDRIDDWGAALGNTDGEGEESEELEDNEVVQRENPDADDAELIRADEIDEDGINEPPIARPDTASTRTDLPVVVDVLRNDEDPDGDVLLITEVTAGPEGSIIEPTGDRQRVQVTPPAGADGPIEFRYTISDGRGESASADVVVEVRSPFDNDNRPPIAVTDSVEARAGSSVALNVLDNDSDPDGDSIVLTAVDAPSGSVSYDGSGQVTYVPDPASDDGTIDIPYQIRDTLGLEAVGTIRVAIRLPESNNEPDARNDSAVTIAGNPVSLNVLLNDTDPDGDAISVSGPPSLLTGSDPEAALDFSLSPDGQFFFVSDRPGQYLVRYSISDGSESDTATIRIDVDEAGDNRPPTAVRDDITIPRGGTSTVYVLLNDTDPDGDVVAIEAWSDNEFLEIESFRGVGFIVKVAANAPDQVSFRYTITDGINEPSGGVVVIAITDTTSVDQPPVLTRDVIEVRPGGTTAARVLLNDFDPEGGPLRVTDVSAVEGVTMRIGPGGQEIFVTLDETVTTGFTFSYEATDQADLTAAEFVDVRIVPDGDANRPPTARADTARTRMATPVAIPVLNNDSDPDGDIIRLESIATQPASGSADVGPDGTITYTPEAGFRGTDRFRYVIVDQFGDRDIGDVLVGVIPAPGENRPPTAVDDAFPIVAGSDTVRLPVVENDFDPDGDALQIIRTSGGPAIEVSDDGQAILFTPASAIERDQVTVTFTYRIDDGRGGTADAVVTVTVLKTVDPEPPLALDDTAGPVRPGESVVVPVLDNDLDPDGRREDLTLVSDDVNGRLGPDPGSLVYTAGSETSTHGYTITDQDGLSSSAFVTILVSENVAPDVDPLLAETPYETPIQLDLAAQASDPDGDELFIACCENPRGGSTDVVETGPSTLVVLFSPDPTFSGQAGFSYVVDDQQGHQVAASATINVLPKENGAPTASDTSVSVEAGTTGTVALTPLVDDEDLPTGDTLTFSLDSTSGTGIALAGDTVTVDAAIDAAGELRSFRYSVTDSLGLSASGSVTVAITEATANPPLAVQDNARTTQGISITVDVVSNDLDEIGAGLRIIGAGSTVPVGAITYDEAGGTVTFLPAPDFFGTAQISYTVEDARRTAAGRSTGILEVDVVGFPGVPPTPDAVADNATATITWGQPAANGAPIEEFELESDQGQSALLPPSSSHAFNGLTNGVDHRFRIRARNEAGWGPWSGWSLPVTPDTEPGRPAAPTVAFGDQALDVNWVEPPNDGSPITGYVLEIGGGQSDIVTLGATTSYTWPNLTNGVNHQFRVIAENASGRSDVSAWSPAEHPLREPDQASPIVAGRGDGFLDLTWSAPNDNGDPIIEYQLEMESSPGAYVASPSESFRWANLPNGAFQRFRVRARNRDVDWSGWSNWSNAERPCGVPLAPAAPVATRGDGQASISWSAPGDQGCPISGYTIEAVGTSLTRSAGAGATNLTFTGLSNGTSYTFRVLATNEEGNGAYSPASNAVVPAGPPFAVTNLTASPVAALGQSSYSFAAPNNNGDAITTYELRVNSGGTEAATITNGVSSPNPAGVRNGLAPNTAYTFQIRGCNTVGCAPWSNSSTFTTFGPPPTPTGLVGSGGDLWVRYDWNPVSVTGPNQYIEGGFWDGAILNPITEPATSTSRTWSGSTFLRPNRPTSLFIRACNDLGCSSDTASVQAIPFVPPNVAISKSGISAQGQPGCSSPTCEWVRLSMSSFAPSTNYTAQCFRTSTGQAYSTQSVTTNTSGSFVDDTFCYFGFPGEQTYVVVNSTYTSNVIVW